MQAYNCGRSEDGKYVIITLEIPEDAKTNMTRRSITKPQTALYRINKAKVIAITDSEGNSYEKAESKDYGCTVLYTVNEVCEVVGSVSSITGDQTLRDYDSDPEKVWAPGIRFFLTKRCAELYGVDSVKNGIYTRWYPNGEKLYEVNFSSGEKVGQEYYWHDDGTSFTPR